MSRPLVKIDDGPIEMWANQEQPVRFVWHGRLYTVREVTDRWDSRRQVATIAEYERIGGRQEYWHVTAAPDDTTDHFYLRHDVGADRWFVAYAGEPR